MVEHIPRGTTVELPALLRLRGRARFARPALQVAESLTPDGPRRSRARSRGMEYAESRTYVAGDDVRHMDWRVTARMGHPHSKLFHESRARDVVMVVDLGASMGFGTRAAFKSVAAAHAAMLLAWASLDAGDPVGAVVSTGQQREELRPASGAGPVAGLASTLVRVHAGSLSGDSTGPDEPGRLAGAVLRGRALLRGSGVLVVISDFYDLDEVLCRAVAEAAARCDVLLCWVLDPLEIEPPPPGRYPVTDGELRGVLDTGVPGVRAGLRAHFEARVAQLDALVRGAGIRGLAISTGVDMALCLGACVAAGDARARFTRR